MQFEEVKELIAIFEKTDLNDMEVQLDNAVVRLNRGKAVPMPPSVPQLPQVPFQINQAQEGPEAVFVAGKMPPAGNDGLQKQETDNLLDALPADKMAKNEDDAENGDFITSPMVGTFYQSSSPEKPPYVNVGDTVSKGDVVCIIEAMKFMNEVTSKKSGKVVEVLVEDGQFVEFGEKLFRLL
ncbi:MAG: acetyl-CoA carboxylase biotin carboxyl carrier protein [Lachnospiraceae bacterium]|nr:acetyl-CoA carboxylase biotin carboxyl carrier protein [Lachnospiraceae bacterium]